jgi:hypothetical protein
MTPGVPAPLPTATPAPQAATSIDLSPALSAPVTPPKGKSKEELLREEVRFYLDSMQKMMQWGVTLMISLQTAFLFLRREITQGLIESGELARGASLPYRRYLIGTGFLLLAAFVVWIINNRSIEQYRHYKNQLRGNNESGITDLPTSGVAKWLQYLYFAFPVADLLIRVYISIEVNIK